MLSLQSWVAMVAACNLYVGVHAASPGQCNFAAGSTSDACTSSVLIQRENLRPGKLTNVEEDNGIFDTVLGAVGLSSGEDEAEHKQSTKGTEAQAKKAAPSPVADVAERVPKTELSVRGSPKVKPGAEATADSAEQIEATPEVEQESEPVAVEQGSASGAVEQGVAVDSVEQGAAPETVEQESAPETMEEGTALESVQQGGASGTQAVAAAPANLNMEALGADTYQSLARDGDSEMMFLFVTRTAKALGLEEKSQGALEKFSAKLKPTTFEDMVKQLLKMKGSSLKSTVKEMAASKAPLSQDGYMAVAQLHSNDDMSDFMVRVAADLGLGVDTQGPFIGVVPWYSGIKAVQSFTRMQEEIQSQADLKSGWAYPASPEELAQAAGSTDADVTGVAGASAGVSEEAAGTGEGSLSAGQEGLPVDQSLESAAVPADGVVATDAAATGSVMEDGTAGAQGSGAVVTDAEAGVSEEVQDKKGSKSKKTKGKAEKEDAETGAQATASAPAAATDEIGQDSSGAEVGASDMAAGDQAAAPAAADETGAPAEMGSTDEVYGTAGTASASDTQVADGGAVAGEQTAADQTGLAEPSAESADAGVAPSAAEGMVADGAAGSETKKVGKGGKTGTRTQAGGAVDSSAAPASGELGEAPADSSTLTGVAESEQAVSTDGGAATADGTVVSEEATGQAAPADASAATDGTVAGEEVVPAGGSADAEQVAPTSDTGATTDAVSTGQAGQPIQQGTPASGGARRVHSAIQVPKAASLQQTPILRSYVGLKE